jgi:hypothetical protein
MRIFERWYFALCWNLRLVIKSWRILVSFRGFFEDYILAWWNIWVFIILPQLVFWGVANNSENKLLIFFFLKFWSFYTLLWHTSLRLVVQHFCSLQWSHRVASKEKSLATTLAKEDHWYRSSGKGRQHEGSFKTQEFLAWGWVKAQIV